MLEELRTTNPTVQTVSNKEIIRAWTAHNQQEQRAARTLEGIFTALTNCSIPEVLAKLQEINSRSEEASKSVSMSLLQHAVRVYVCCTDVY